MKFKNPDYLENIKSPYEGEALLKLHHAGKIIVGIDEVGRGPLAGPVVACAAVLKEGVNISSLNDSKKLSRKKREAIFEEVKNACACYAIASASAAEIDEINILEANFLAMRRALNALGFYSDVSSPEIPIEVKGHFANSEHLVFAVDGPLKIKGIPFENQITVIKGDGLIASISAASILAKVYRDKLMDKLAEIYPHYAFEKNAGYGTKLHLEGIKKFGFCKEHRMSFKPKSLEV